MHTWFPGSNLASFAELTRPRMGQTALVAYVYKSTVTFRLMGDGLDPDRVTAVLGIQPSRARPGMWRLRSELPMRAHVEDHLTALLDRLDPVRGQIAAFISEGLTADFFCGLWVLEVNEGVDLDARLLSRIVELRSALAIDIYKVDDAGEGPSDPDLQAWDARPDRNA